MIDTISITLEPYYILVWIIVGLVAGFLASRVMLGHGMGIIVDILVGLVGAFIGGLIATYLGISLSVPGHPVISQIIMAFLGALILLLLLRVLGVGRRRRLLR